MKDTFKEFLDYYFDKFEANYSHSNKTDIDYALYRLMKYLSENKEAVDLLECYWSDKEYPEGFIKAFRQSDITDSPHIDMAIRECLNGGQFFWDTKRIFERKQNREWSNDGF